MKQFHILKTMLNEITAMKDYNTSLQVDMHKNHKKNPVYSFQHRVIIECFLKLHAIFETAFAVTSPPPPPPPSFPMPREDSGLEQGVI